MSDPQTDTAPQCFMVYTPVYGTVIPVLDFGEGPMEYSADVLYVRCRTKRRAKVLAVRAWRRQRSRWVMDQYSDGASPFTGLKVEVA